MNQYYESLGRKKQQARVASKKIARPKDTTDLEVLNGFGGFQPSPKRDTAPTTTPGYGQLGLDPAMGSFSETLLQPQPLSEDPALSRFSSTLLQRPPTTPVPSQGMRDVFEAKERSMNLPGSIPSAIGMEALRGQEAGVLAAVPTGAPETPTWEYKDGAWIRDQPYDVQTKEVDQAQLTRETIENLRTEARRREALVEKGPFGPGAFSAAVIGEETVAREAARAAGISDETINIFHEQGRLYNRDTGLFGPAPTDPERASQFQTMQEYDPALASMAGQLTTLTPTEEVQKERELLEQSAAGIDPADAEKLLAADWEWNSTSLEFERPSPADAAPTDVQGLAFQEDPGLKALGVKPTTPTIAKATENDLGDEEFNTAWRTVWQTRTLSPSAIRTNRIATGDVDAQGNPIFAEILTPRSIALIQAQRDSIAQGETTRAFEEGQIQFGQQFGFQGRVQTEVERAAEAREALEQMQLGLAERVWNPERDQWEMAPPPSTLAQRQLGQQQTEAAEAASFRRAQLAEQVTGREAQATQVQLAREQESELARLAMGVRGEPTYDELGRAIPGAIPSTLGQRQLEEQVTARGQQFGEQVTAREQAEALAGSDTLSAVAATEGLSWPSRGRRGNPSNAGTATATGASYR
jgi:hypothetical protein